MASVLRFVHISLGFFVILNQYHSVYCQSTTITTTPSTTTTVLRPPILNLTAKSGLNIVAPPNDGYLRKRDVKVNDLDAAASAKSYDDPPPEFYRGPGSLTSSSSSSSSLSSGATSSSTYHNHRDSVGGASFFSKPITFPDTHGTRNKYGTTPTADDRSTYLANEYNNWQLQRHRGGGFGGGRQQAQDRISVKHYGNPEHATTSAGVGAYTGGNVDYQYNVRPSGGASHYYDYVGGGVGGGGVSGGGNHYGSTGHTVSYYGAAEGGSSDGAGGIPFDVYGHKGHYGGGSAAAADPYAYTYQVASHEQPTHKGQSELSQKALLAKSFLIPLASAAVLGIAAALVSNPLLLQLGTVSGGLAPAVLGKRRRRALSSAAEGLATLHTATKDLHAQAKELPYRGHNHHDHHQQQQHRHHHRYQPQNQEVLQAQGLPVATTTYSSERI